MPTHVREDKTAMSFLKSYCKLCSTPKQPLFAGSTKTAHWAGSVSHIFLMSKLNTMKQDCRGTMGEFLGDTFKAALDDKHQQQACCVLGTLRSAHPWLIAPFKDMDPFLSSFRL